MMWSRKYSQCQECGTAERRHVAKGLCTQCYERYKYRNNPEGAKKRAKERYERNPEPSKQRARLRYKTKREEILEAKKLKRQNSLHEEKKINTYSLSSINSKKTRKKGKRPKCTIYNPDPRHHTFK